MHASQRCYGELEELTIDDIWQIADAGHRELRRLAIGVKKVENSHSRNVKLRSAITPVLSYIEP